MGLITVRVQPRSRRSSVELDGRGILIRVRAVPEAGRANEEARLALAKALGVPGSSVTLRRGARFRTKVFEVQGVDRAGAEMRLRTTRDG